MARAPEELQRKILEKATVDGFVAVVELHPTVGTSTALAADAGRIVAETDVVQGPLTLALLDVPNVFGTAFSEPTLMLAASSPTAGWKRCVVEISFGGQNANVETARSKSVLGNATTALASGAVELADDINKVEVQLLDDGQWLTSCDDDALASGENLAVLGSELIQFGRATPLGSGRFRLEHLLRARGATEWACGTHAVGEHFCLLQSAALQTVKMPVWSVGATVAASGGGSAETSVAFMGQCVRPLSPVNVAAVRQSNGDLALSWTRRSRQRVRLGGRD